MRLLVGFVVVLVLFSGCSRAWKVRKAQKKMDKIVKQFPEVLSSDTSFVINKDTLLIVRDSVSFDTIVTAADTIQVVKNNIITEIQAIRDTITQTVTHYRVNTIVLPDTAYIETVDTNYVIQKEIVTKTEYVDKIPLWLILLCIFLAVLFVITYLRNIGL